MASVINTNVASLSAQRNLSKSQSQLTISLERLSTGLRINSARDDAAGLAISNRMTSQIRGMDQAARNANDAISLAQTGESAMDQMTTNLQRMRELSIQSSNATNTDADRQSLDAEFQQLLQENDRIAETTSFNGRNILDGSMGSSVFQVGANVGETISVDISQSMRTDSIGSFANASYDLAGSTDTAANIGALAADVGVADAAGEIVINGTNIAAAADNGAGKSAGSAFSIAEAINKAQDITGVTATAKGAVQEISAANISGGLVFTDNGAGDDLTYTMNINGTQIFQQGEGDTAFTASELANAINNKSGDTGVTAKVGNDGGITLTAADGRNIEMTEELGGATATDADAVVGYFGSTLTEGGTEAALTITKGSVELSSNAAMTLKSNTNTGDAIFQGVAHNTNDATSTTTLNSTDIRSVDNANASIQRIDKAISQIDRLRGTFGAVQSRFESAISSLQSSSENISAARSRIMDTDFAAETAAMTRAQILQQAGSAMVSQANALPQGVLSLLG